MKLTPQQINERIAAIREPKPPVPTGDYAPDKMHSPQKIWTLRLFPKPHWIAVGRWATDDGQACKLLDEMPNPLLCKVANTWSCQASYSMPARDCCAKTRPLAICLAWLARKGVAVETMEDEDD